MKFDPLVKSQNNKLYLLSDDSEIDVESAAVVDGASVNSQSALPEQQIAVVKLCWNSVEMNPGEYNEELLAALRDYLKKLEENGRYAFIEASAGKELKDADEADSFIAAMVHAARRIKDAVSVVGFSIADELLSKDAGSSLDENSYSQWFVNEMNKKHGHYVYFISKKAAENFKLLDLVAKTSFILY